MKITREQGLLLLVIAFGAWYYTGLNASKLPSTVKARPRDLDEIPTPRVVLGPALPNAGASDRRLFSEPSESSPLPPRSLPFPELARLPVVLPPLTPGQEAGQFWQLRLERAPVEHQFSDVAIVEAAATDIGESSSTGAALQLDKIAFANGNTLPVVIHNKNKIELALMNIPEEPIRYDWVSPKDGRVIKRDQVAEPKDIAQITLADTIENRIGKEELRLKPAGPALVPARKEFIDELLRIGPKYPQFYKLAEQQAQECVKVAAVDGSRWLVKVLRAQGAMAREWALYTKNVPADLQNTPFLHRGKGQIAAKLSLWADAEREMRRAVEIDPTEPRSQAALARFLLERGRPKDALEHAQIASQKRVKVAESDGAYAVGSVLVEVQLALGNVDRAQLEVGKLSAQNGQAASLAYLRGAVSYAAGDYDKASTQFTDALTKGDKPDARLGIGLCAIATGRWDDAKANLEAVAQRAPMLRHRAHAALALLYELTGQLEEAQTAIDNALLAAPEDPYSLYLQGRLARLQGNYDGALTAELLALAQRDDLVESLAEITRTLFDQSQGAVEDRDDVLARASRYADRLVKLDAARGKAVLFHELSGRVKFELGDMAGARQAFNTALDRGSDYALIGLGAIDYKQNRITEARGSFSSLAGDPSRPDEVKGLARALVDLIDDHSSKEQVRDSFDREELGGIWESQRSDQVAPRITDNKLAFRGRSMRGGAPAYVRRSLERGGHFLMAGATLQVASGTSVSFAGIELVPGGRGGSNKFSLRCGIFQGTQGMQPYVLLSDGNKRQFQEVLNVDAFDPFAENRIEIETVDGSKPNTFRLLVRWNGTQVWEQDELRTLRPMSSAAMHIELRVEARGAVDATFDDFRLNRRRTG